VFSPRHREPLEVRKATLASVLAKAGSGLRFNEHIEADGATVCAHASTMGLEGSVSKRKSSTYRSGRPPYRRRVRVLELEPIRRAREAHAHARAEHRARSCIIDGEAVRCGDDGVPSFDRIRYCPIKRAVMSNAPPVAKGTMMCTGRAG
jgi:ATP-dependent DNA ligase